MDCLPQKFRITGQLKKHLYWIGVTCKMQIKKSREAKFREAKASKAENKITIIELLTARTN